MSEPLLIITTLDDEARAREIAALLVERQLAACITILPAATSVYAWEGEIQEDAEHVLLIKSLGEALEIALPDGSNRYDGHNPSPHPHVVCIKCRKILDPDLSSLQDMTDQVAEITGFTILNHRLDFFGLCPECRKKQ